MSNLPPALAHAMQFVKPVHKGGQFIPAGAHTFAVREFKILPPAPEGQSIEVKLEVIASTTLAPGSAAVERWNLTKPVKFPGSPSEFDHCVAFVGALVGAKTLEESKGAVAYAIENAAANPLRGIVIRCNATTKPATTTAKAYTRRDFSHVDQDAAAIAAMRARLDATEGPAPVTAPPAPVAYTPPPPAFASPPVGNPPGVPGAFVPPWAK